MLRSDICGILLAAGASRRFGSNKLLHPLDGETPVALAALANLRAVLPRVIAVVRPGGETLASRLSGAGASVILCPDADEGMGASLAAAVRASGASPAWVIALADMPYIRPETITRIAAALAAGAAIAAPAYQGSRGHPVGMGAAFRGRLESLRGDEGARSILEANAGAIALIEVDDPGVRRDIDTPADLATPGAG